MALINLKCSTDSNASLVLVGLLQVSLLSKIRMVTNSITAVWLSVKREQIMNTKLLVYLCKGDEPEIKDWFKTINIAGVPLTEQEILNAVYSGPFVTRAREEFSNSQNTNIQKWSTYIAGDIKRQAYLERALDWVSGGAIDNYMSMHRNDKNITELKKHFDTVIDWVSTTFTDVESEMKGLEWNRLYETYHKKNTIQLLSLLRFRNTMPMVS